MNKQRKLNEIGQSLVIVALGLVAFVAMLALVIDGANAYAAKRQAQNAADAGALAGAQYMCQHMVDDTYVISNTILTANQYAVLNDAIDPADVNPNLSAATVVVTATVKRDTFFAGVIGFSQVTPVAVAKAACQNPGVGVLPVAWSCREDVTGNLNCAQDYGPCRNGDTYDNPDLYETDDPYGLNCTYVLMDSVKVKDKNCKDPEDPNCYLENDLVCSPQVEDAPGHCYPSDTTKIDCDMDNDCSDELMTGGARSWLDLDGSGGGANELKDWISGKVDPPELRKHYWVPEESGVATSIFHTTADYLVGDIAILPVFNKVCNGLPFIEVSTESGEGIDQCSYWTGDNQDLITNSTLNFHIISFSAFHVTCVQTGKNKVTAEANYFLDNKDKDCYGHAEAVSQNLIDDNDKTIEGYFVRYNLPGYGSGGEFFDTGTFTVVLVPYP